MTFETDPLASSAPRAAHEAVISASDAPAAPSGDVPAGESAAAPASVPAAEAAAESSDGVRPSERIRIGTQREDARSDDLAAKPNLPSSEAPAPVKREKKAYPPPNVRDRLSPELERELQAALGEGSIEELLDATTGAAVEELTPEARLKARVISVHEEDVFVDLGVPQQGVMPLKHFATPPAAGAEVDVMIARYNADQGLYEVTAPAAAVEVGNWDEVQEGQVIEVTITGHNKGGLECQTSGIRGFIPLGQISLFRVENPEEFVGQRLACVVTEANRSRRNLVLSHRALMERERKESREKMLQELAPGQVREGTVRSLQDFGAFVDLGGVDGLVHVSQLSWERVTHPSEVLQVGQKVKVRVEKVNRDTGKISLIYRDQASNPWEAAETRFAPGSTVRGAVSKIMQFGAFVKLAPGVEGLIHISELGHGRVQRVSDVISEQQEVEVKVLSVDKQAQRISLSLKALMPKPERAAARPDESPAVEAAEPSRAERSRKRDERLKGGLGGPSGGEKFGLKW
jgi:small subunit ribosomal protein S1